MRGVSRDEVAAVRQIPRGGGGEPRRRDRIQVAGDEQDWLVRFNRLEKSWRDLASRPAFASLDLSAHAEGAVKTPGGFARDLGFGDEWRVLSAGDRQMHSQCELVRRRLKRS